MVHSHRLLSKYLPKEAVTCERQKYVTGIDVDVVLQRSHIFVPRGYLSGRFSMIVLLHHRSGQYRFFVYDPYLTRQCPSTAKIAVGRC